MIRWESPRILKICETAFDKIALIALGVYCWHFLTTLRDVEIPLIKRKIKWRWAYLYYFGGRYLVLFCEIIDQLPMSSSPEMFETIALMGSMAVICASGNLLLRTMAIWRQTPWVLILLGLTGLGHWAIMLAVTAVPIATEGHGFSFGTNGPSRVHTGSSLPFYLYTFVFDFLILLFTILGLYRQQVAQTSPLWRTLYKQGVLYFVATFLVNVPLLVLGWLDLNVFMSGIFAAPNLVVSVITSSGAVTSLLSLKETPNTEHVQTRMQPAVTTNMASQRLSTHINLAGVTYDSNASHNDTVADSVVSKPLHPTHPPDIEALRG